MNIFLGRSGNRPFLAYGKSSQVLKTAVTLQTWNKVKCTLIKWKAENYSIIDLIKKSADHFSKDHISLGKHMKEGNNNFFCQYSKHHDDWLERKASYYLYHQMNNTKIGKIILTHLQRKQVSASIVHSTLFEMNIRRRCSVWVYERKELWFDSMLNDQTSNSID